MLNLATATRKQINNALCNIEGKKISGVYYGKRFSGEVVSERGITTAPYDICITVKLDAPIITPPFTRDTLLIDGGHIFSERVTVNEL